MVILPSLKKIFIHIPKTGGASLTGALRQVFPDAIADGGEIHGHQYIKHIRPSFPDWEFFAVIRNPWDMLESYYRWLAHQKANHYFMCSEKVRCFVEDLMSRHPVWRSLMENYIWYPPGVFHTYCDEDTKVFIYSDRVFDEISEYLGVTLPSVRINHSDAARITWSQDLIDAVAERASGDIERFGFTPPKAGD